MPAGARPDRGGRWTTHASALIAVLAVAAVVLALAGGGSGDGPPQGGGARPELRHVGGAGCDDLRGAVAARDPAKPWCTLAAAARKAPPGSEVLVAPGRYAALRLDGEDAVASGVVLRAADPARPPELAGLELTGVRGLTLAGFRFTRPASLEETENVTIRDGEFAGTHLFLRTTRGTTVEGNRIHGVTDGSRALLAQGSFTADGPTTEDLVVRGNRFEDIEHDAIAVYNGYRRVLVEGNEISRVSRPAGFELHSDAMQFMGGEDLTVRDNVVYDSNQGILIKDGRPSTGLVVAGNLITRVTGAGLQIFNAPGARVANNTVWDTRFGTIFRNDGAVPSRTSVRLDGNVLDQLIVDAVTGASVTDGGGNVFGRGRPYGEPSYLGEPNFVDPEGGDLRIVAADPGAGLPPGRAVPGSRLQLP